MISSLSMEAKSGGNILEHSAVNCVIRVSSFLVANLSTCSKIAISAAFCFTCEKRVISINLKMQISKLQPHILRQLFWIQLRHR